MSLTVIHDGLGRDSRTIACLLAERRLLLDGVLVGPEAVHAAVFADTGAEWPHTYALLPRVRAQWEAMGIPFYHLRKPPASVWRGHERPKGSREEPVWRRAIPATIEERAVSGFYHMRLPIREEYVRHGVIAVTSSASCTDNHKVQPMRRHLSDLSEYLGGLPNTAHSLAVRQGRAQPHRIVLGFTADEASRAAEPLHVKRPAYERLVFPLLAAGISKDDEAPILWRHGWDTDTEPIFKSGCFLCPYQPAGWFWVLSVQHPDLWAAVVEYEATALARHPRMHVLGSTGRPLPEAVAAWRQRNPRATVEDVLRKEYSRCSGPAPHPAQLPLIDSPEPAPGQHLVTRLHRLLARSDVDPELLLALAERLSLSGRGASAARARLAAQVAGVILPRGEDLDGEQLELEVSA